SNGTVISYFDQQSTNMREREFTSVRFGVDYFLDNRNTITFSQGITQGRFKNNESQRQDYFDQSMNPDRYGERTSDGRFQFNRNSSQLFYTHTYPKEGKELSGSVNVNYGDVEDHSDILNTFYLPGGGLYENPNRVRNNGANENNQVTVNIDFVNPISETGKIEMGLRSYINNYESYFNSFSVNNGSETKLPLSNNHKYQEQVHAAYLTYTGMMGTIG